MRWYTIDKKRERNLNFETSSFIQDALAERIRHLATRYPLTFNMLMGIIVNINHIKPIKKVGKDGMLQPQEWHSFCD